MEKTIEANLIKSITIIKNNVEVIIPEDSVVLVDLNSGYGIWNELNFDIFRDEYVLTN